MNINDDNHAVLFSDLQDHQFFIHDGIIYEKLPTLTEKGKGRDVSSNKIHSISSHVSCFPVKTAIYGGMRLFIPDLFPKNIQ